MADNPGDIHQGPDAGDIEITVDGNHVLVSVWIPPEAIAMFHECGCDGRHAVDIELSHSDADRLGSATSLAARRAWGNLPYRTN